MRHRIVHVVWRLSAGGGIPRVHRQVLSGLDPSRFDARVVSVRPAFTEDRLDELGSHVTRHHLDFTGRASRVDEARLTWAIGTAVRKHKPDILHVYSGLARFSLLATALSWSSARVLEMHDAPGVGRHRAVTDKFEVSLIRRGGFHPVVHSNFVRQRTAAALGWVEDRLTLIPLGVDPGRVSSRDAAAFRSEHGIAPRAKVVSYVGGRPVKNSPLFLRVARDVLETHPETVFLLFGGHPAEIREQARSLGLVEPAFRMFDWVPHLRPALAASDVFLSTADDEGFGLAVAEAMAEGVPVVGTAAGGVCDVVEDGVTGSLAAVRDRMALGRALRALLDDNLKRRIMGEAARRRVEDRFTLTAMLHGFESFYTKVLETRSDRTSS